MKFTAEIRVVAPGATLTATQDGLRVCNATELLLLATAATDYNLADSLTPLTYERALACHETLAHTSEFADLLAEHEVAHPRLAMASDNACSGG